jgi:formylglycine-generating enzyme required for sulfatase activity
MWTPANANQAASAKQLLALLSTTRTAAFWPGRSGGFSEPGDDESPLHYVTLAALYIGRYDVIVAQFKACVDERGCTAMPKAYCGAHGLAGAQRVVVRGVGLLHVAGEEIGRVARETK